MDDFFFLFFFLLYSHKSSCSNGYKYEHTWQRIFYNRYAAIATINNTVFRYGLYFTKRFRSRRKKDSPPPIRTRRTNISVSDFLRRTRRENEIFFTRHSSIVTRASSSFHASVCVCISVSPVSLITRWNELEMLSSRAGLTTTTTWLYQHTHTLYKTIKTTVYTSYTRIYFFIKRYY